MDISVIVPFYKGNQYMAQLFEVVRKNAANAKHLTIELLLVNDSPDCPIVYEDAWVQGFALRILNNQQNVGIHKSRIYGIRAAKGTYIQLLDQDDLLADDALASQLAALGTNDIVVCNGVEQTDFHPGVLYRSIRQQKMVMKLRYYYSISCMITSPGQCLIRKAAIPELWLENPLTHNGSDDYLLWLIMLTSNCRWTVNPQKLYTHVATGKNLSADLRNIRPSTFEAIEVMKENGLITPKQERLFLRRWQMLERYYGKGAFAKLLSMTRYPDLSLDLLIKKLRGF